MGVDAAAGPADSPRMTTAQRYDAAALRRLAAALFEAGGMEAEKAATVAELLVEGDLLGHDTHGLAQLGPYLDALASGAEPQYRVIKNAPIDVDRDAIRQLFRAALHYW